MKLLITFLLCIFIMKAYAQTNVQAVADTNALKSYSGSSTTVNVQDSLTGGLFNYVASGTGLATNGCTLYHANGISPYTGYWQRQRSQTGVWLADWWGIKRDSSIDETPLMQQAIDYISGLGGGTLQLTSGGKYIAGVLIKDNVHIVGGGYWGLTFHNGVNTGKADVSWTCPNSTTSVNYCIATQTLAESGATNCAVSTASVSGITFYGRKDTAAVGIHLISWRRGAITNCSFYNFSNQAILQDKPESGEKNGGITFRDLFANGCCLNASTITTGYEAVMDLEGNDDVVDNVLLSALPPAEGGSVAPTGNGNIYDLYLNGGNADVINSVFQYADIGVYVDSTSVKVQYTNNKTDATSRQGIVVHHANGNQFVNNVVSRSCQETNTGGTLYTGAAFDLQHTPFSNKIVGLHVIAVGGNGNLPQYAVSEEFTDSTATANDKNEIAFVTANATDYTIGLYYSQVVHGSYFYGNENVQADSSATPNVAGYNFIEAKTGTTITSFSGGTPSQIIYVWFQHSATVDTSSTISLISGTNCTYPVNSVVGFRNILGKWYEIGTNNLTSGIPSSSQSVIGSTLSGGNLALKSTTNATKGSFTFDSIDAIAGSTGQLGLGTTTPLADIDVNINPTASFSANGAIFSIRPLTQLDNTSSGTIATVSGSNFAPTTFATALDSVHITYLANVQFGLPIISTHVSATNILTAAFLGPIRISTFGTGVIHTDANGITSSSTVGTSDLATSLSLTGTPVAPTAGSANSTTQIATTAYVKALNYQRTLFTPANGNTITLSDHKYNIVNPPSGTIATLTITMPSGPTDGDVVLVKFIQGINTTITWQPPSATPWVTIVGGVPTILAGGFVILVYDSTSPGTWY